MNTNQRLVRSSTDRMLGGVCGGLAQYLSLDPTLVRIAFVLLALSGVSPLIYVVLWVVVPSDRTTGNWSQQVQQAVGEMQERATTAVHGVSDQVQKLTNNSNQTPPAASEQETHEPSTGPTRRL